jgi:hypothetical protein
MIANRFTLGDDISGILQEAWQRDEERDYRDPTWEEILSEGEPYPEEEWTSDNPIEREALRASRENDPS